MFNVYTNKYCIYSKVIYTYRYTVFMMSVWTTVFSTDHSPGVQLLLRPAPRPLLPHHPGVCPAPAGRGGLHPARCVFSLLHPRPDDSAEQGEEGQGHQASSHSPRGLHRLFHTLPCPSGVGVFPSQSRGGRAAGSRCGTRAGLSHHSDSEQPQQLPGSSGVLLCDGQL